MPNIHDLPRELRDKIYEQFVMNIIGKQETRHFITAFTGLLMSNKQAGLEAVEVCILRYTLRRASAYSKSGG